MKTPDQNPDPLDELFAARLPKPSKDLADRTLDRLEAESDRLDEAAFDEELDFMLESQEVVPSQGFADQVVAAAVADSSEPEDDKVVGFPSWTIAIGGIAAAMVLGIFSFVTLFDYAKDQRAQGASTEIADSGIGVEAPQTVDTQPEAIPEEVEVIVEAPLPLEGLSNDDTLVAGFNDVVVPDGSEVVEYESVLTMDEALGDALILADVETLNALSSFLN
ncbi:MAG: hypothetical protein AAFX93_08540 [Verrucomicrobiota bacterium]